MKAQFRRLIASYFEHLTARTIKRYNLKVVAVVRSVGKTSTKMAIATVLGQKYRVLVHQGNYNSEVGLPLSVFEQSVPQSLYNPFAWLGKMIQAWWRSRHYQYDVLVLELGTDRPGDLAIFWNYLTPDIGVVTAIAPEHMTNFPDGLDQVAAEELSISTHCGTLIAAHDEIPDKYRRQYINGLAHHLYYGQEVERGFSFRSTVKTAGSELTIKQHGHVVLRDQPVAFLGPTAAQSLVAAWAVGDALGLTVHQLTKGLSVIKPVAGRLNPLPGTNNSLLIDDTYNSSPQAVTESLQLLESIDIAEGGRRIAVLGSMNELGATSQSYHEQAGQLAAAVDFLVTIGTDANRWLGPAAVGAGLDPTRYKPADSPYAAGAFLKSMLHDGDIVLIKGSQNGVFAEECTKLILADPTNVSQLVRQSSAWLRLKKQQFTIK